MNNTHALPEKFASPASLTGLPENTPILVAFSGGADSSALLCMLTKYAKASGARICAAHVNHMIRGAEADRDEQFCRMTAQRLDVELFVCRRDVPEFAKESSQSIETAARQVRYEFFEKIMEEQGIPLLATAHNANDNLETQIFNMIRGCGLAGMCGIPETRSCRTGTVIRPILGMSRREILEYCEKNGLEYVTDSTNVDTDYTRNKIRAEVIPILLDINSSAVENASRLASSLRSDSLCLTGMADWFLEEMNDDASFETEKVIGSPPAIANRAIMSLYYSISGGKSLENTHIEAIRKLCVSAIPHSSLNLPHGIDARIENGRLYLEKHSDTPVAPQEFCVELTEGETEISQINAKIIIRNSQNTINIYKNSILLYFDSAKINGSLVARNRRPGDKIRINGVNKSVKKLLCDKKIPLSIRYRLPVICDDDGIVAIPMAAIKDGIASKNKEDALCLQFNLNFS